MGLAIKLYQDFHNFSKIFIMEMWDFKYVKGPFMKHFYCIIKHSSPIGMKSHNNFYRNLNNLRNSQKWNPASWTIDSLPLVPSCWTRSPKGIFSSEDKWIYWNKKRRRRKRLKWIVFLRLRKPNENLCFKNLMQTFLHRSLL